VLNIEAENWRRISVTTYQKTMRDISEHFIQRQSVAVTKKRVYIVGYSIRKVFTESCKESNTKIFLKMVNEKSFSVRIKSENTIIYKNDQKDATV
jgi:hypothetical protein